MHRAEQIVDAAVTLLDAALSAQVFKARTLSLSNEDGELPAITVNIGTDDPVSDLGADNLRFIDSLLELRLTAYAQDTSQSAVLTDLMALRVGVHKALMADQTLGLGFVMSTRYGGADAPEVATEGAYLAGRLDMTFRVLYRMSVTDPEN